MLVHFYVLYPGRSNMIVGTLSTGRWNCLYSVLRVHHSAALCIGMKMLLDVRLFLQDRVR